MIVACLAVTALFVTCGNNASLKSFSEPQQYSGKIEIDSSKNVILDITISADAKQITEIKLSAEKLYLTPENFSEKQSDAKDNKDVEFTFSEHSSMKTFMKIETTKEGVRYVATDESGHQMLGHLEFTGGFASKNATVIDNGKLQLNEFPLICDLKITNSRISGNIKIILNGGGTQTVDVELKNMTSKDNKR